MITEVGLKALNQCYDVIGHTREAALWRDIKQAERVTLLRHAELDPDRAGDTWAAFTLIEQQKILTAIERAAQWATRLKHIRQGRAAQ